MLPTFTWTHIPYVPGQYDDPDWTDTVEEDCRHYHVVEGKRVPLHGHVRVIHENGVTQGEGTYLNGYKEGIWRFFNRNGILVGTGSYNKCNNRWRKWRCYEELEGKSRIQMIVDIRGSYERYWIYDMDGKLTHEHVISNLNAPIEEYVYNTEFYNPSNRPWPSDF